MNENNAVNGNSFLNFLSGLSNGDKGFVCLLLSLIGAYGIKRYFDSTDKAMEHGYNTSVTSPKYGEVRFKRSYEGGDDSSQKDCCQSSSEELEDEI